MSVQRFYLRRLWLVALLLAGAPLLRAGVLWSDLGPTLAHETQPGADILGGALKRDNSAADVLYFKFHVDPLSDAGTEEYFAALQLFEGDQERLGIGNSLKAWAYSAFNTATNGEFNKIFGDIDLRSPQPESSSPGVFLPYELPRRGMERTVVFKVQYVPGGDDLVTVWLNPDLGPGATEAGQPDNLTTRFPANASFDSIRLRHGGGGGGWTFSDMEIATSFADFLSLPDKGPTQLLSEAGQGSGVLNFRSWQREQGLPQNAVHAIVQTRDGYLWIGNDQGVARFDGVRFVSFGLQEGLGSGPVRCLFEDHQGNLWIGTAGSGLARREGGHFVTFTKKQGLPSETITALGEDGQGNLWIGTEAGLAVRQNGSVVVPAAAERFRGKPIEFLARSRQGTLWVGVADLGIFKYQEERFVPFTDSAVEGLLERAHCWLEDKSGRLWIGAGDDYVLCREGSEWRRYRIPRHLARPYVTALAEEPDGTVWAGSISEGLVQFKQGKLAAVNASGGLLDNSVAALLVDREGNLWVGTAAGLNRLRRNNLFVLGQNEGLGYGPVQGITEIGNGVLWAGKPSDGLCRWAGRGFRRLNLPALSGRYPEALALLSTRDGTCWMSGAGVWRFRQTQEESPEVELAGLAGATVLALAEDAAGGLWAGTREGQVWLLREGQWVTRTNFWQPYAVTALCPGKGEAMWVGTQGGGLACYQPQGTIRLDKQSGLLSDWIRTLFLDREGTLWIGTTSGGLGRWQQGRLFTFTTREGLPDNTISQILEDDAGRLWIGSNRGIAGVKKSELADLAAGRGSVLFPQIYGKLEGMVSEECTGGYFPAGFRSAAGRLWFPTLKGIAVIDPHLQKEQGRAPEVVLEETMVDGVAGQLHRRPAAPRAKGASLPAALAEHEIRVGPGQHRLEFRFTGLSFSQPDRVRFRYRLEPLEPGWVEAGERRSAFYSYMPPGEYRFRVTACNSSGVWSEQGASMFLIVLPHFWQTRWFLVVASLLLLASVAGGVRVVESRRHQRRLKQLEQQRALERERARIAQDLHDDLGSSLTRISLLSDLARAEKDNPVQVEAHANKISLSAGQTVRALEEIVWALRPGSDSLQSLVEYIAHFANELFDGSPARCRLDLPADLPSHSLPPEMRHNIFLVVKEALTNALKHSQADEVQVRAKVRGNVLEIEVQDNGNGFEPPSAPLRPGKQHGQGNMRRRAEDMGGTLTVESVPGQGTTVRLKVSFPA